MKEIVINLPDDVYASYENEEVIYNTLIKWAPLPHKKRGRDTLSIWTPYGMLYRTYMSWKQQKRDMNFTREEFIKKFITKKKYLKMHKKYIDERYKFEGKDDYKDRKKMYDREVKQIKPSFVFASDLDDIKIIKYSEVDRNNKRKVAHYVDWKLVNTYESVAAACTDLTITPTTLYRKQDESLSEHFVLLNKKETK